MIHLLRNYEKKFGKEIGFQLCSKELKELKKILKKMNIVIVAVICYWILFLFFLEHVIEYDVKSLIYSNVEV